MKRINRLVLLFSILSVVAIASCEKKHEHDHSGGAQNEEKQLYTCPMHPSYISDKPGNCPICNMTLVPVEKKDTRSHRHIPSKVEGLATIHISPEKRQLIGVKTDLVSFRPLISSLRTYGIVAYAEPNQSTVSLKFEGWVEKLYVNKTGEVVKKGMPLLEIYSPELFATQQEYILALKTDQLTGDSTLSENARRRLKFWDITDAQIQALGRTKTPKKRLTVVAPFDGTIVSKNVVEGQKVMPGDALYTLGDNSKLWVVAQVYEENVHLVKEGMDVTVSLAHRPEETVPGKITYVYPYITRETRTNPIRVELHHGPDHFRPDTYINVDIHVDSGSKLTIPKDAILDSGTEKIAFVDHGDGMFEPRSVTVGTLGDAYLEVVGGLQNGERVVTQATFFVDSESRLKSALERVGSGSAHAGHGG